MRTLPKKSMLLAKRLEIIKLKNDLENPSLTEAQRKKIEKDIEIQREAIEELKQEPATQSDSNDPDLRAQRFAR